MPGNGHVRFGPEVAGKGPAPSGHLAGGLPAPRTQRARFLGYEITVQHNQQYVSHGRRAVNGLIALHVPTSVIKAKCDPYMKSGKPGLRPELVNDDDHTIVSDYGAKYRGLAQYYLLAGDVARLDRVHWVMLTSMLKTLGAP